MSGPQTLAQFYETLGGFIEGTNAAPWKTVAQYLGGRTPKSIAAAAGESQIAERCWKLLCDPSFDQGVISFYNPGGWRDEYDNLARRLGRNARGLFATALAAAEARRTGERSFTTILEWFSRAVGALDATSAMPLDESPEIDELADARTLLATAFDAVSPHTAASATAHLWSLHWLDDAALEREKKRSTWIAWASNGASGCGTIEVADTGLKHPAIIEHAESALVPAEKGWLDSLVRAWKLSGCAKEDRTFSWNVRLPQPWVPLAGQSAGVAFYVTMSCLRTARPCDPSRAVLAALPVGQEPSLTTVRSIEDKITTLPNTVRSVGIAEEQLISFDHIDKAITKCPSLEAAVEFISDFLSKMRSFVVAIAAEDSSSGIMHGPYMEPTLKAVAATMPADRSGDTDGIGLRMTRSNAFPARAMISELLNEPSTKAIVLGDGGYGKTLLVKEAVKSIALEALASLEQCESSSALRLVLPLEAGDIATAIDKVNSGNADFDDRLVGMILEHAAELQYPNHSEALHFIIRRAMDGATDIRVLVTVDNLDRLAAGLRDRVFAVLRQLAGWPCSILLTSREYAFEPEDLPGFAVYRIRELTPSRARRHAVEVLADDPARAAVVSQLLISDQSVTLLARSPLLLVMICHAARRAPGIRLTRTALYRDYLLERLGFRHDPLGAQARFELLYKVASEWFETAGPVGEVKAEQLASWISGDTVHAYPLNVPPETAHRYSPSLLTIMLLEDLVSLGIFVPTTSNRGSYRASHPSLIEYLAGVSISAKIEGGGTPLIKQVAADAIEPKWRDIIPFVAGSLQDPAPLLAEILNASDPFYLRLFVVANCLAEISSTSNLVSDAEQISRRLVDLLRSPSKTLRRCAIDALGRMGIAWGSVISPLLKPLLNDSDVNVRGSAIETACALAEPEFTDIAATYLLQLDGRQRDEVLRRLGAIAPKVAAASAKTLLGDPDFDVRSAAAEILVTLDEESYRSVIEQLKDGDGWSRRIAARALALSENPQIVDEIKNLLGDDSAGVRAAAVEALTELRPPWKPKDWIAPATDESPEVRLETTRASTIGTERLRLMLSDSNERVVLGAIETLLSSGNAKESDFEPLLNHTMSSVRMKAAEASCRLGNPNCLDHLLQAVVDDGDAAFFALASLASLKESESVEPLLEILATARPALQLKIIGTLGRIGDQRATAPLIALLTSFDTAIQAAAALAVGRIGDGGAYEPLNLMMKAGNASIRRAAVNALGMLRESRSVECLLDCLKIPDAQLIVSAASAIKSSTDFSGLIAAIDAKDGPCSFALSCPMPWVVYDILQSYAAISPSSVWAHRTSDFAELTAVIHQGSFTLAQ